ncbi:uncharacterized protein LOC131434913 [Malaya genurostris]|uniref:uncharacterized protein LOC131434913 n=1 Tax=Malaya genurostris TaxID=325434 RepID=UPI0026F38578|nr:uncharacterized protein LOC131434913 [Malaya genurostris]XP_058458167.1 uncharacterized protein LOC131434913 [Malaya genurostris]XP_058458168.1 uncharacterized protein LOC131434913 [Malaya genurostris]XP_058458169.1 uncharacterized protein LOC131434913 [Malaya genurostris]XP_058458170.1 uncharacterized protein LOC131434913 [Malaya genurostris]
MAKVSASSHQDPTVIDMMEISKKRPPKLKSADRTVSVRIDNYSPGAAGGGSSPILLDNSLIVHHSPIERLSPVPHQKQHDPKVFFLNESSSSLKAEDYSANPRKQMRRSDTLHVYSPSMHQLRKATSFHSRSNSGGSNPDEIVAAPIIRHSSVRHSHIYPREYLVKQDSGGGTSSGGGEEEEEIRPSGTFVHSPNPSGNRRNYQMHRSFNEQQQKRNAAFLRRDSVKFHSLGDDMPAEVIEKSPRESKKFSSANASLENEIYRSRSNSRSEKKNESFSEFVTRQNSKKYNQKNSTTSLDQALPYIGGGGAGSFRRSVLQHSNAHLLSPNPLFTDEFKPQKSPIFDQKKSYSLRYKNGREARETFKAKKSKSFIMDLEPPPAIISGGSSPYRKDSIAFTPEEVDKIYKASRKLSPNLILDDIGREISPVPMDIMDINYGVIMKTYQMNRQKSMRKSRRKGDGKKPEFDEDTESNRKRKRIACIVMTVFIALAIFSILAVIVTLTHTSAGPSQTKPTYTFARDTPIHAIPTYTISKDSPKHYNGGN